MFTLPDDREAPSRGCRYKQAEFAHLSKLGDRKPDSSFYRTNQHADCVFVQIFSGKPVQKQPLCIEPDKQTFFLTRIDKFRQFGLRAPSCWKRRFDITIQGV